MSTTSRRRSALPEEFGAAAAALEDVGGAPAEVHGGAVIGALFELGDEFHGCGAGAAARSLIGLDPVGGAENLAQNLPPRTAGGGGPGTHGIDITVRLRSGTGNENAGSAVKGGAQGLRMRRRLNGLHGTFGDNEGAVASFVGLPVVAHAGLVVALKQEDEMAGSVLIRRDHEAAEKLHGLAAGTADRPDEGGGRGRRDDGTAAEQNALASVLICGFVDKKSGHGRW